jgi:hypothetical protein
MHNTYFETYNLLTCPTTVAHVEQIRKGSYIGSRRWRIAAIEIVTAAPMSAYQSDSHFTNWLTPCARPRFHSKACPTV